jgi:hypothetical protein
LSRAAVRQQSRRAGTVTEPWFVAGYGKGRVTCAQRHELLADVAAYANAAVAARGEHGMRVRGVVAAWEMSLCSDVAAVDVAAAVAIALTSELPRLRGLSGLPAEQLRAITAAVYSRAVAMLSRDRSGSTSSDADTATAPAAPVAEAWAGYIEALVLRTHVAWRAEMGQTGPSDSLLLYCPVLGSPLCLDVVCGAGATTQQRTAVDRVDGKPLTTSSLCSLVFDARVASKKHVFGNIELMCAPGNAAKLDDDGYACVQCATSRLCSL